MISSIAWEIGRSLEILIVHFYQVNYAEFWGNCVLAQNIAYVFNVTSTFNNNIMLSISEAISRWRKLLSQHYSAMGDKWGGLINAMLGAILLEVTG